MGPCAEKTIPEEPPPLWVGFMSDENVISVRGNFSSM